MNNHPSPEPTPTNRLRDDLIASHQRRLGTDRPTAAAAVDDVLTRGAESPHHRDVIEAFHDPDAAYAQGARNAITALLDHIAAVFSHFAPVMDWARTPEGIAALTYWATINRFDPALPCICLCPLIHSDRPTICDGSATVAITRTSPTVGTVDITVCHSCAQEHNLR
ncbi:hypothetical protein [Nocardiopsis synnemataformans]|uniref:hypothetical protein n=1 Tax=Nocardiopsis synnemataformans TaxID=61305 RepID=UPI003EBAAD75